MSLQSIVSIQQGCAFRKPSLYVQFAFTRVVGSMVLLLPFTGSPNSLGSTIALPACGRGVTGSNAEGVVAVVTAASVRDSVRRMYCTSCSARLTMSRLQYSLSTRSNRPQYQNHTIRNACVSIRHACRSHMLRCNHSQDQA